MFQANAIEANSDTLLRQAPMTAEVYFDAAVDFINKRFGKDYAKQHPELIGAFMQTCSMDFGACVIARGIESLSCISEAITNLGESLRSDHPLQGETFDGITSALEEAANALHALGKDRASSPMGAIEFLASHMGEKLDALTDAITGLKEEQ